MQKICIWFLTNSKAFLKKRMFYITVFVMFILCLTLEGLSRDSSKDSVGLMLNCEDNGYFDELNDCLSKDRDVITYDDFSDIENALIKDKISRIWRFRWIRLAFSSYAIFSTLYYHHEEPIKGTCNLLYYRHCCNSICKLG